VQRAFLCGEGFEHRKQFIECRLQTLSECFVASVCGFAVMDNHFNVLVRLGTDDSKEWSAEDVVRRWLVAYPPKSADGQVIEVTQAWINDLAGDQQRVDVLRARLSNLGWFMKALCPAGEHRPTPTTEVVV
jgi:hypothetical protein